MWAEELAVLFVCLLSDQGWWDKPHRGQFWRSSQLYSPCQRSELSCWHPPPWEWRRAAVLDCRPSWASHTSPQRLAQPGIFRPASPPSLCNKVLSALEYCLPGLVLEKHFLCVCFGWAISSSGTLYIIETTYMTYNALNSMLSDQNSFHFHVPSLQQSLCSLFLLVYCFLSVGFPTPLSVPRQTDGPRAVQRLLLPASPYTSCLPAILGALCSGVSVHDLFPSGIKITYCHKKVFLLRWYSLA